MANERKRAAGSWIYVLKVDRELPELQQSKFTLRPLTGAERDYYRTINRGAKEPGALAEPFKTAREVCLSNIERIDQFPASHPMPWPEDYSERAAYLEKLDDGYVLELGVEVLTRSMLGEEERQRLGESQTPQRISTSPAP